MQSYKEASSAAEADNASSGFFCRSLWEEVTGRAGSPGLPRAAFRDSCGTSSACLDCAGLQTDECRGVLNFLFLSGKLENQHTVRSPA